MKILNRILADNRGKGLFRVENAADDEATIYLYDAIVSDDYFGGVSATSFVKALAETTAKTIHLRINCPGGDVFAGQAMAQALREKPAKCIAHIDGYAASAASWVALACDESVISEGGIVMIHQAQTLAAGNAEDLRASADVLEKVDNILVDSYAKATGQSREQIVEWMQAETWFSAQEAVDAGFADKIAESAPKNMKSWNLSAYANAPQAPQELSESVESSDQMSCSNTEHMLRRLRLAEKQSD